MNDKPVGGQHDLEERRASIRKYIMGTAAVCAGIAIQPIPVADIFILTPIQAGMVLWIGTRYGYELSPKRAREILTELAAVVGAGYLAQQTVLAVYKLIPILGGLLGAPWVFGVTYGIGIVAMKYFESGMRIDRREFKKAFDEANKLAKGLYQRKPACYKKPQVIPLSECKTCEWSGTCREGFTPLRVD